MEVGGGGVRDLFEAGRLLTLLAITDQGDAYSEWALTCIRDHSQPTSE